MQQFHYVPSENLTRVTLIHGGERPASVVRFVPGTQALDVEGNAVQGTGVRVRIKRGETVDVDPLLAERLLREESVIAWAEDGLPVMGPTFMAGEPEKPDDLSPAALKAQLAGVQEQMGVLLQSLADRDDKATADAVAAIAEGEPDAEPDDGVEILPGAAEASAAEKKFSTLDGHLIRADDGSYQCPVCKRIFPTRPNYDAKRACETHYRQKHKSVEDEGDNEDV